MTTFIVTLEHNGEPWPLRGTVWAFRMERAQVFDTREAAQAQLDKARKFMPAKLYRAARIVSTDEQAHADGAAAMVDAQGLNG